jgi:cyclopropane fatty-acyl-phospholipid synthase-like methyltransferase
VEKRIQEYGLEQFYNSDHAVLDIGCNFGFFVAEFAHHCRLAHGIEPNSYLNKIGELTSEFLGVGDRVEYFDQMFADFENPIPYDTILSLAAFFTGDGRERSSAEFYFTKVNDMLADGGHLFYESTSYSKVKTSEGYEGYPACLAAMEAIETHLELLKEWETPSGSPEFRRQFAIARKKS